MRRQKRDKLGEIKARLHRNIAAIVGASGEVGAEEVAAEAGAEVVVVVGVVVVVVVVVATGEDGEGNIKTCNRATFIDCACQLLLPICNTTN